MTRHTWQSWRERYKKNAPRLDVRIAQIVQEKKPALGEKGQYGYVRKPEEKPKRTRRKKNVAPETNGDEFLAGPSAVANGEDPSLALSLNMAPPPPPPPGMTISNGPPTYSAVLFAAGAPPPFMPLAPAPPVDPRTQKENAQEQEMEDGEEESQWSIRIAPEDAPPPTWAAKRPLNNEDDGHPAKKPRLE